MLHFSNLAVFLLLTNTAGFQTGPSPTLSASTYLIAKAQLITFLTAVASLVTQTLPTHIYPAIVRALQRVASHLWEEGGGSI